MSRSATCSFLWGVKTDATAKESIWTALRVHTELKIEVTFHKKNGSCFACLLDIVPIKNEKGQVVLFLVSHKDLTTQKKIGTSNSLLSCGLASTMTAAALIAKRQPALISPTPNHLSPRIPLTRKRLQSDALSSSRRASAPPANTSNSKNVPLMQFGSFGVNSKSTESTDTPPSVLNLESVMETAVGSNDETEQVKWLGPNFTTTFSDQKEIESVSTSGTDSDPSTTYKYQRRRSRAVLYHLSGRFDKKNKPKMRFKNLIPHLSSKNSMPEYKVQDIKASRCILLHYSILKIVWDWLVVLCTFYFAVMVPYNAAFHNDTHERTLRTLDMILEVLFIVDILLNFRTTYVSKSGQVVHQSKEIAVNYIRGWFILDLIAAVPFDVIWTIQSPESPVANWMHLMKLARLLRLARLFQKIERYSQYSAVVLGILMCMFFLVAHWLACSWFGLGTNELMNPLTQNHSWLYELSERTHTPFHANMTGGPARSSFYISSLYFTMSSLTSVGFGNVSPNTPNEKIFSIIAMLVGALMHAAVFGNVTTIIQRMYARRSAYQSKNQDLKDFTRAHHLPKQLRQRMLEFYQAMWSINRGIDKQAIIQVFPEEMRGDIALHINREILSLPIFKSASIGCQKSIAQLIGTRFSTPGEFLVHRGDAIRYIYFVCSGSLEILDEEGSVVALLGKCDFFGTDIDERPFIGLSAYDVKALTYCELQFIVLDKTIFDVLDLYPKYLTEFSASLHDELSFNIKEGYDPFAKEEIETLAAITRRPSEDILPPKDVVDISNIENGRPAFLKHDLTHSDSLPFPIQLPFKPMRPFRISCPTVGGEYLKGSLECLLTRNSRCNSLASGEIDLASQTGGSREHSRWFLCEQDSLKNDYWTEKPSNPNHHSMETGLESRFPFACTRHHQSAESFFPHSITVNCQEQQAAVETVNKGIVHSNDTDDKTSQLSQESSQCAADFKELKLLMFYMAQNIQSMRQDMKSLCNEVNTLKQDMNRIQKNSTFSHRSSFKTGIMKASSTANSLSAEEFMPRRLQTGHLVKSRQYFSSSVTEDIEHSSHSENRCVKFRLPNSGGRNQHNHHHNQKGNSASPPHPLLKVSSEVQFESLPEYIEKVANNDVTTTLSTNSHSTNSISKPPSK